MLEYLTSNLHQKHARVVVTGGAGFIGSHTVDRLLEEGKHVTVLDDLSRGKPENINRHKGKKNFSFVHGDIRNMHIVKKALKDADAIIHLAALANVKQSFDNPHLCNEINIQGTLNLLQASLDSSIELFIYASSAAVYGHPEKLPIREDHPLKPLSPYGISKMAAESYTQLFHKEFGLGVVSLRYFNVYGPRQTHNQYAGVITKFLDSMKNNSPLRVFGDGRQSRDFINIKDVVEAHLLVLTQEVVGETFNIGTGTATTINKLAAILLQTGNKTSLKIVHTAPQKGDIRNSIADISKAKEKLHFIPSAHIKEGLKELADSYQVRARYHTCSRQT